ncbi:MAG: aminotransferase class I/II-fold pyridoxal phosphate-dependent enzyme [Elusimicrobia bacterium]|nr:aminotransferase class I/II-fold pyridoxal phosphate-dependent enzyme [Elusimicrobiota bacterium]MDE2426590.1 aminotransferase class I/II-fold pyridoxal phosphate-dependent enzyme [Elusimicrobiota bacterium]
MRRVDEARRKRIFLSSPHMGGSELEFVREAFETNWIAPAGPHIAAFEREFCERIGITHAVALSSGTAALHLALRVLGVQAGEDIFCSTLTFAACANAIVYERARPVFIDSDEASWNMDPSLLEEALARRARRNKLPRAVVGVDLYGQAADWDAIRAACRRFDVPIIEDAAEALGATYRGRSTGTFGWANVFSFNGNKIITTSGGGLLATEDAKLAEQARHLSQQARDEAAHYQHSKIGFNYRMSNVLAGIGRGQLRVLNDRIEARRRNFAHYEKEFQGLAGLRFMPEASYGRSTRWLTCLLVDPEEFGADREEIRLHLERQNIESRPVWKPLHLQPVFADCDKEGGQVAEGLFQTGLCLPSGSNLTEDDLARVTEAFLSVPRRWRAR